jgi:hypothetical protein
MVRKPWYLKNQNRPSSYVKKTTRSIEKPVPIHETRFETSLHPIQALLATAHHPHASVAETLRGHILVRRWSGPRSPHARQWRSGRWSSRPPPEMMTTIGNRRSIERCPWTPSGPTPKLCQRGFFRRGIPWSGFLMLELQRRFMAAINVGVVVLGICWFAAIDADEDDLLWSCRVAPSLQVHAGRCMSSTEWS